MRHAFEARGGSLDVLELQHGLIVGTASRPERPFGHNTYLFQTMLDTFSPSDDAPHSLCVTN